MSKDFKLFALIFGSMCVLFLGFMLFRVHQGFKNNLSYNFSGVVDSVTYDEKGTPIITINKQQYILSAGYNFDHQIQKGDNLKKEKGNTTYTLMKKNTGKIILFNN